eukprot:TRINITY_DN316_c0_g1_i1.p11 TRINITY_DN316_c0_g1~~TRINITY_DN316_c0_g1_i1.p11  ORF type:complete len:101 (+),score=1.63 TRINITY_DN316_c0_g1_i1:563-865(+)
MNGKAQIKVSSRLSKLLHRFVGISAKLPYVGGRSNQLLIYKPNSILSMSHQYRWHVEEDSRFLHLEDLTWQPLYLQQISSVKKVNRLQRFNGRIREKEQR